MWMLSAKDMKVKDLYNAILHFEGAIEMSVCEMKAECISINHCSQKSKTNLISFDQIACEYGKKRKIPTPASVDGVGMNGKEDKLLFVEKKSWSRFFYPNSDEIKNDNVKIVESKIQSYDLESKYRKTCKICQEELGNPDLFNGINHSFIFVTDLHLLYPNQSAEPVSSLVEAMVMISNTSNKIIRQDLFDETLNMSRAKIENLDCVESYYLGCNQLDQFVDS